MSTTEIIFEEVSGKEGDIGLITLNRPQVLNALNHSMFIALDEHLQKWEIQNNIKAVVIRAAEGRAFCAGGDIRYAYELKQKNDASLPKFFRDEYRMNLCIRHFPKPYIALLNGITMGGGAGISMHGSFRIGTENLVFAMPETAIGFYPDVGMTYVLSRLPHKIGIYLGLTGAKISWADCFALGLIQQVTTKDSLNSILSVLVDSPIASNKDVVNLLQPFSIATPVSELINHREEIEKCFSKNSVEDILNALEQETSEWCQRVASSLKTKSPTSLKVTLQVLQQAEHHHFDQCMQVENNLTWHFIHGHDFFEGIRALIIDKDQEPHWQPDTLAAVDPAEIEKYFQQVTTELV